MSRINGHNPRNTKSLFERIQTIFDRDHLDVFHEPIMHHIEEYSFLARYDDDEDYVRRILILFHKYIDPKTSKSQRKAMDLVFKVFMGISLVDLMSTCRDQYDWQTLEDFEIGGGEKQ
tara:strand:- start:785 stop:1138 length:354 start_codon:yes stop_codon:yes gene_type:complete